MRPSRHILEIDGLPIFIQSSQLSIPSIISKTVFHADDNPIPKIRIKQEDTTIDYIIDDSSP